jgi:hypothetical protein
LQAEPRPVLLPALRQSAPQRQRSAKKTFDPHLPLSLITLSEAHPHPCEPMTNP